MNAPTIHDQVQEKLRIRNNLPHCLREAVFCLMMAAADMAIAKRMAGTREQRPAVTGYCYKLERELVDRQHAYARRATLYAAHALAYLGIAQSKKTAWSELSAAVALYRSALTTGKPDLIGMRELRALQIMDRNDFGCRVIFDSLSGHVWREYGERDPSEEEAA
jgi:hypothetical protein